MFGSWKDEETFRVDLSRDIFRELEARAREQCDPGTAPARDVVQGMARYAVRSADALLACLDTRPGDAMPGEPNPEEPVK